MQGYVIVDLKAILQLEQQCRRATTVPTEFAIRPTSYLCWNISPPVYANASCINY